jgi:hypothetical protein
MTLSGKYDVIEPAEPEIRSFHAREIASGRLVTAHLMQRGYTPENKRVLQTLLNLPRESRQRIIEVGEHEGVPFVVTEDLGAPLTEWLRMQGPAAALSPLQPEPGEFTKMFGPSPASPAQIPQPREENGPELSRSQPGEFTLTFESPGLPLPGPSTFPPPAPKPATPVAADAPEEFTIRFESPLPVSPPPAAEFPQNWPTKKSDAPILPVLPEAPRKSDPILNPDATEVFQIPDRPAPRAGTSDYTQIISARPVPQPPPLRPQRAPEADSRSGQNQRRARNALILTLILLGLLAVAMILVFALTARNGVS